MKTKIPTLQYPANQKTLSQDHWIILLVEFVHLLGLFLIHTRHAKSARATTVLFDQLVRHLNILSKYPDHDGGMLIRQVLERDPIALQPPNYLVIFGDITLQGDTTLEDARYGRGHMSHFGSALRQAFGCLAEQGIQALYLQLPGRESLQDVDRLRLALHIVARFQPALENAPSISFRYYGRILAIPLIRDRHGQADPNLTLMAGLNGLSAANTREIIKQAEAYSKLLPAKGGLSRTEDWYNRIICEPRLRRHLIRPPVEINNLPWADLKADRCTEPPPEKSVPGFIQAGAQEQEGITPDASCPEADDEAHFPNPATAESNRPVADRDFLRQQLNDNDSATRAAVEAMLSEDYPVLNPYRFGRRLADISHVLDALDQQDVDPAVMESLLIHLNAQLEWIPGPVILSVHFQRKGLRIENGRNILLVGMVHPRLFDLVTLVRERLLTRLKIEAVQSLTFGFQQSQAANLASHFEIGVSEAHQVIALLKNFFDDQGRFIRNAFEDQIDQMAAYNTPIFEMLWCLFKQTADRKGRLDFLNAIQLLMARLSDAKAALRFLLSDIFQNPFEVKHMDRNAIVLANILLRTHNQELRVDINQTPEDVLKVQKGIERQVQQYVSWRLDFDQTRIMTKLRTIGDLLHNSAGVRDPFQKLLFDATFLVALEREICIFLALIGGKTARIILRQALGRYAFFLQSRFLPDSDGQRAPLDTQAAVDQLKIIVQGLGRIGRKKDADLLDQFKCKLVELKGTMTDENKMDFISGLLATLTQAIKAIPNG